jgi:hypothetical protein
VPEPENLNRVLVFQYAVEDQDWRVNELAHPRPTRNGAAQVGKRPENFYVVQNCGAELLGGGRKPLPGVREDFVKIC